MGGRGTGTLADHAAGQGQGQRRDVVVQHRQPQAGAGETGGAGRQVDRAVTFGHRVVNRRHREAHAGLAGGKTHRIGRAQPVGPVVRQVHRQRPQIGGVAGQRDGDRARALAQRRERRAHRQRRQIVVDDAQRRSGARIAGGTHRHIAIAVAIDDQVVHHAHGKADAGLAGRDHHAGGQAQPGQRAAQRDRQRRRAAARAQHRAGHGARPGRFADGDGAQAERERIADGQRGSGDVSVVQLVLLGQVVGGVHPHHQVPVARHRIARQGDAAAALRAAASGDVVVGLEEIAQQDVAAHRVVGRQEHLLAPGAGRRRIAGVADGVGHRHIAPGQAAGRAADSGHTQVGQRCLAHVDGKAGQVVGLASHLAHRIAGIAQHQNAVVAAGRDRHGDLQALGAAGARCQTARDRDLAQVGVAAVRRAVGGEVDVFQPACRSVATAGVAHGPAQGGCLAAHQGAHAQVGRAQVGVHQLGDRCRAAVGSLCIGGAGLIDLVARIGEHHKTPGAVGQIGHGHAQAGVVGLASGQRSAVGQ